VVRRETAARGLALGLVGILAAAASSGPVRPGHWLPGSRAGQPGPEGSTWLGIGDETRHRDLTIRLRGIEDQRCPGDVECVREGEVRVHLDVASPAGRSARVLAVAPGGRNGFDVGAYRVRVTSVAPDSPSRLPFVWAGVALLVEDLPCDR
jgi:hypothetical protein